MISHDDLAYLFLVFHNMIKTKVNETTKILWSDNEGEQLSHRLQTYLTEHGIQS